ncbi:phenazine biosynthesis protein PhzF [Maritimibacter sp. 55A14]|uniref:PhzF family phenazine biosynthesis protein n=1 Tax=Maritimibacter sp. 55A14 TaxID=2174844 RepID=UPI000D61C8FE|nr:PhzF family phenazine biosynthesis protein [Maritimibacter sp. 55A14]PWE29451.1 phenazine biosynthesis protein PhzF [Maritimibacter sp. 55A14]
MSGSYSFDWVDAFTDRAFGGNPCTVFHDAAGLDEGTCMALVRETGQTENTFLGPSEIADARVRYFLANREIPFAGHPTVASVVSLLARGLVSGPRLRLETVAGMIEVDLDGPSDAPFVVMTQDQLSWGADVPAAIVADILGLASGDILGQPQIVSTGLPYCIALVRSADAARRARLNLDAMARYQARFSHPHGELMEPFMLCTDGQTEDADIFARHLMAPPNPPEDAFTGSAMGCAAAYLWRHGLAPRPAMTAAQGDWMGRPGRARIQVQGPRNAVTAVRVAGQGRVIMSGRLRL